MPPKCKTKIHSNTEFKLTIYPIMRTCFKYVLLCTICLNIYMYKSDITRLQQSKPFYVDYYFIGN